MNERQPVPVKLNLSIWVCHSGGPPFRRSAIPEVRHERTQCNAMMIMGAGVSLYAHISLTNVCA